MGEVIIVRIFPPDNISSSLEGLPIDKGRLAVISCKLSEYIGGSPFLEGRREGNNLGEGGK